MAPLTWGVASDLVGGVTTSRYLLLEFQSSNDPYMAVRMLTYIGLLYQDLIKSGQIAASSGQTRPGNRASLPAVFPLVLYNGLKRWRAAQDIEDMIEPSPVSLKAYRPRLRYFLFDIGRVPEHSLQAEEGNAIAGVVRLERSTRPEELGHIVGQLAQTLKAPHNRKLRRALAVWIKRVLLRRFVVEDATLGQADLQDLNEVHDMIGERIDEWKQQLVQQGVQQGEQKGKLEGKLEGLHQGELQALKRLLTKKFGELPSMHVAQLEAADLQQIEVWFDRAVDATDLQAVFKTL